MPAHQAKIPESRVVSIDALRGFDMFLIIGGGIKTPQEACRVIEAGADAVAIGTAAMQDPGLCGRMQAAIRLGN